MERSGPTRRAGGYSFAYLSGLERGADVEPLYWRPELLAGLDRVFAELPELLAAREDRP